MLQTVDEEGGIYAEVSDKALLYVVLRYLTLYIVYHCADNSTSMRRSTLRQICCET